MIVHPSHQWLGLAEVELLQLSDRLMQILKLVKKAISSGYSAVAAIR